MVLKIWQFWSSVDSDGKYKRVVCKFCNGHEQIKHAAKCRRHTITCSKVPKSIKDMLDSTVYSSKTVVINSNETQQSTDNEIDFEEATAVEMIVESNSVNNCSSKAKKYTPRMLTKGGRNRNSNILSAALCLIKELDFASLEVLDTAIHCRMEEVDPELLKS